MMIPALAAAFALVLAGCGGQSAQADHIGVDAAKAIALEAAGIGEAQATFTSAELDDRDGLAYYDVEFTADGQRYEYDIDAVTGVVIDYDGGDDDTAAPTQTATPEASPPAAAQTTAPTEEEKSGVEAAKQAALAHAGLTEEQVTFIRSRLDQDDGRRHYDVVFKTAEGQQYDYDIDAETWEVLAYDYDQERVHPVTDGQSITAERAKEIALAEVPGATVNDIYDFEVDRDDGRLEYEGKIRWSGMEYEFTIDGYSGAIRSWEAENADR